MTFGAHVGERLREERDRLGMSQQDLSDLAAIRREMLSRYERGAAEPGAGVLMSLAGVGVDILYVLTGGRTPKGASALAPDESALLDDYKRADEGGKAAARTVLSALARGGA